MALVKFTKLAKELENRGNAIARQVNFAAANALNDCAAIARIDVAKNYERVFVVRNKSFGRSVMFRRATPSLLMASVFYKNDFMELHTKGGTRKPTQGREALSVPIYENDRRMANGKTRKRDKVPALLEFFNANGGFKTKNKSAVKKPFLLKVKGKAYVVKRAKGNTTKASRKKGNGDIFLFSMLKDVKIEKTWDFDKVVNDSVDRNLEDRYFKRLRWALDNAKSP